MLSADALLTCRLKKNRRDFLTPRQPGRQEGPKAQAEQQAQKTAGKALCLKSLFLDCFLMSFGFVFEELIHKTVTGPRRFPFALHVCSGCNQASVSILGMPNHIGKRGAS